jgi:hypothetical protein
LSIREFHPCKGEYRASRNADSRLSSQVQKNWLLEKETQESASQNPSFRRIYPRMGKTELSHTASLLHIKRREVGLRKRREVGHRCMGPGNATSPLAKPVRLMYLSVSDSACEPAPSPSPRSSLTHAHRCIGPRDATTPVAKPARLMYISVSDSTGAHTPYPLPSPLDTTFPCST